MFDLLDYYPRRARYSYEVRKNTDLCQVDNSLFNLIYLYPAEYVDLRKSS